MKDKAINFTGSITYEWSTDRKIFVWTMRFGEIWEDDSTFYS